MPSEIKAALDDYVIGQERAKKVLSVAVYNHYKRVEAQEYFHDYDGVELEKSNILAGWARRAREKRCLHARWPAYWMYRSPSAMPRC